jgi:hypothetical protein
MRGDVLELCQRGFPPRECIRMPSLYVTIQPSLSVWKRVKASRMEEIWSSLNALPPIVAGG